MNHPGAREKGGRGGAGGEASARGSGTMGAGPGARLSPPLLEAGGADSTPASQAPCHGVPGMGGGRQGRKAEMRLCKKHPLSLAPSVVLRQIRSFSEAGRKGAGIEIDARFFFFWLMVFLRYKTTVENNFS